MPYPWLRQTTKISSTVSTRTFSGGSQLLRRLSTAAPSEVKSSPRPGRVDKRNLYRRLSALGSTGGRVSDVLFQLTREGKQFLKSDLVDCLKDLRKYGRYQHCLEILEWMERGKIKYSERDYALRLGIISKLKGIDEADKYFDSLPPDAKNHYTYGALLNCYCTEKMTDKALALFEKMDEMNYASNVLAFNNLMGLYMKVGQPEKLPPLIQQMKERNIPLSNYTYSIWMQSLGSLNDLEGVERVIDEVQEQGVDNCGWTIYSNLAAVYIKAGQLEKADSALKKMEEVLDNSKNPDRMGYHYLISLYASTGKLETVIRAWDKLKSKFKVCHNSSYLAMLLALSKLDDIEGLTKYLKEWELSYQSYDDRLPTVVISAYLRRDLVKEAEQLLKDATNRAGQKIRNAHFAFMTYFLSKRQIESALKHMEVAVANKWYPTPEKVNPIFEYFKEEKDVDGIEDFCRLLKKAQPLDSSAYLWLLRIYEAAGRTAPEMRHRMEEDGVDVRNEHEELLQKVCPS